MNIFKRIKGAISSTKTKEQHPETSRLPGAEGLVDLMVEFHNTLEPEKRNILSDILYSATNKNYAGFSIAAVIDSLSSSEMVAVQHEIEKQMQIVKH